MQFPTKRREQEGDQYWKWLDAAGNVSDPGRCPGQFYDMSAPHITSGNIISNDKNGYIVSAIIEDDVAVSKVQFAAKLKEQDVKIWMTLNEFQNNVSEKDKNLIAEKLGEYIIGTYTDITLWKQFNNESEEKITEIAGTITIQMEIPEKLINTNSVKERTYGIIHAHGNKNGR